MNRLAYILLLLCLLLLMQEECGDTVRKNNGQQSGGPSDDEDRMIQGRVKRDDAEDAASGPTFTATEELTQQDQEEGSSCISDLRGRDGRDGKPGVDGQDGTSGAKGEHGVTGSKGDKGDAGSPSLDMVDPGTVGTTYVRWGRTTCPYTASLIYEGIVAGDHFTHTGGGTTLLCLPHDPDYLRVFPGEQGWASVYSTEYEINGFPPFIGLHDHEVPCAVCRVSRRGTKLMIPAKIVCPNAWTEEYQGYLMTAHHSHSHAQEIICVDENAEARSDSKPGSDNGALLYPIEGICNSGSLPCRPYIGGFELTCVVCTI